MAIVRTGKEVARHLLHSVGIRRRLPHLAGESRAARFQSIYDDRTWSYGRDDIPLSGEGSSVEATASLRSALPRLLDQLGARLLLDVGCGDFTWMAHTQLPCRYIGVDIVPSVIERNSQRYADQMRSFHLCDIVEEPAPSADVILCREVLFHLSLADVRAALRNMLASGCGHLLLTSDRGTEFNSDIESGDFRQLNLERAPFRLPRPLGRIDDTAVAPRRYVGLWSREAVLAAAA